MIQLITAGISAYASLQAGKAREDAARIDAFNTETERVQGQKLALQQAAERRREFDMALWRKVYKIIQKLLQQEVLSNGCY